MNIAADRLTRQRLIGFAVLVTSVLGSVGLTASLTDARAMMESLGNASPRAPTPSRATSASP
jgi:hypothetical protein